MDLFDYIKRHTVAKGCGEDFPLSELIVDEPEAFVSVVRASGYYISHILWWERARIGTGSRMGLGGPRDRRCPELFFFSETFLEKDFEKDAEERAFFQYFEDAKRGYPGCDLYPGFDLAPLPT